MFYAVQWLRGGVVVGEKAFSSLLEAKAHAKGRLALQKVRKGATAVVVCDKDGVVYFRFGEGA
jgi:hypothetical protein